MKCARRFKHCQGVWLDNRKPRRTWELELIDCLLRPNIGHDYGRHLIVAEADLRDIAAGGDQPFALRQLPFTQQFAVAYSHDIGDVVANIGGERELAVTEQLAANRYVAAGPQCGAAERIDAFEL